ncbi:MAG: hypothetical protein ABIN83_01535 [Sphingomicrobium sp.]
MPLLTKGLIKRRLESSMRRMFVFGSLLLLPGCRASDAVPSTNTVTMMATSDVVATDVRPAPRDPADPRADQLAHLKSAIRSHATVDFVERCGVFDLPDDAFVPIELNGGGTPEVAVLFGRAYCRNMGASGFSSTGGSKVQIWSGFEDMPARMLAEADMEGFTPGRLQLTALEHGSACGRPGATGCIVTYRWATPGLSGMTVERHTPDPAHWPRFTYERFENHPGLRADGKLTRQDQLAQMRAAIRQDARVNYALQCGSMTLDDNAFIEVELTGDNFPELAVSLARGRCAAGGANTFEGNGGPVVQFWHMNRDYEGHSGPVRLMLETDVRGFTPGDRKLVVLQHNAFCPGNTALGFCRVTYRWHEKSHHLDASERKVVTQGSDDMRFGQAQLGQVIR